MNNEKKKKRKKELLKGPWTKQHNSCQRHPTDCVTCERKWFVYWQLAYPVAVTKSQINGRIIESSFARAYNRTIIRFLQWKICVIKERYVASTHEREYEEETRTVRKRGEGKVWQRRSIKCLWEHGAQGKMTQSGSATGGSVLLKHTIAKLQSADVWSIQTTSNVRHLLAHITPALISRLKHREVQLAPCQKSNVYFI